MRRNTLHCLLLSLPALFACDGIGGPPPDADAYVFRCDSSGNVGWQSIVGRCTYEGVEYENCPVPREIRRSQFTVCLNEEDDINPHDWENHQQAIREACVVRCEKVSGQFLPDYPKVCEVENMLDVHVQPGWEPGDAPNCKRSHFRSADGNGSEIDWVPGGSADLRAPLSCDLNSTCCEEFPANICGDLATAGLNATGARGADYVAEATAGSFLRLDLPGNNADDTEPVSARAEYTALDCGEETCPFYLADLSASGEGAVWNVRFNRVVRKEISNLEVQLMQPILGAWSPQDGTVVFQEGALRLRTQFELEGPVVHTHDGSYDLELENDAPAVGEFNAGALTLRTSFQLQDGTGQLDLTFEPTLGPPVASVSVPENIECNAVLEPAFDTSYDPDGGDIGSLWFLDGSLSLPGQPLSAGEHTLQVRAENERGAVALSPVVSFSVGDTRPPRLQVLGNVEVNACNPALTPADLVQPVATDECDPAPRVEGRVVASTDEQLELPLPLDDIQSLGAGEHTVEWVAVDADGNSSEPVRQTVTIAPRLFVTEGFDLRDRARIVTTASEGASLVNLGQSSEGPAMVGVEALVGTLLSDSAVDVRDRAMLRGGVIATGAVSLGNDVELGAPVVSFAPSLPAFHLPAVPSPQLPVTPSTSLSLEPDRQAELAPGAYTTVAVHSRSTLALRSGVYAFGELRMEPQSILQLDMSGGPLTLVVSDHVQLRSTQDVVGGDPQDLTLVYLGPGDAQFEFPWDGNLYSPNAHVVLGAGGPQTFSGSFLARSIEIRPDTTFVCREP